MTDPQDLPKIELHLHLEGAAQPGFIRDLAARKGLSLSGVFDESGAYQWEDFAGFLDTYSKASALLTSPEDFHALTASVLANSTAQGVVYTEIFISPDICGGGDAAAWSEYLAAILEAAEAAKGIHANFISTAIRNHGAEAAENAARLTVETMGPRLTGFGMGGEERFGRAEDFARAFAIAGEAGLGLTSHAGEFGGAQSVRETLDHLKVSRIGHGVRAIEDPDLVARLAEERIMLEVNPGSNISLGVFPSWEAHPIQSLRDAGVPISVSTDDPPYFHTDIRREYRELARVFGWTVQDFRAVNLASARAAFCDEDTRRRLVARLSEE